ncbi:hypothetical protein TNCV_4898611 [Trichonephila clavipes]|nr:hypothetical protein TNCV_4898611 [Trichonephila clavipes]
MYSWDRLHRWIKDHLGLLSEVVGDSRFEVEDIKVDDGNLRVHLSETKLNVVANVLDNNTVENIIGEKVNCAIIKDLVLSSRDQLIEEQKTDSELGHIYRFLENPEDSSVDAAICENWSRDFRLVEGFLFYAKYATSLNVINVPKTPRCLTRYLPCLTRVMISSRSLIILKQGWP